MRCDVDAMRVYGRFINSGNSTSGDNHTVDGVLVTGNLDRPAVPGAVNGTFFFFGVATAVRAATIHED